LLDALLKDSIRFEYKSISKRAKSDYIGKDISYLQDIYVRIFIRARKDYGSQLKRVIIIKKGNLNYENYSIRRYLSRTQARS
jgi:hypothetical protein